MDTQKRLISVATLLLSFFWINTASASTIGGTAAGQAGVMGYFIPLHDSNNNQVYGGGSMNCYDGTTAPGGFCSDTGNGVGYYGATALSMDIHFDLSNQGHIPAASLWFAFDDLDLKYINDPYGFKESLSLSVHNGSTWDQIGGTIKSISDMMGIAGSTVSYTDRNDPLFWNLDLGAGGLDLLSLLQGDELKIKLGFGSKYKWHGKNTPEYLAASLHVVPVPAAFWLFGTALIGFIGFSRRTRV